MRKFGYFRAIRESPLRTKTETTSGCPLNEGDPSIFVGAIIDRPFIKSPPFKKGRANTAQAWCDPTGEKRKIIGSSAKRKNSQYPCRDRRPRLSEKKKRLHFIWLLVCSHMQSKTPLFSDSRGRLSLQERWVISYSTDNPMPFQISFVGAIHESPENDGFIAPHRQTTNQKNL